MSTTSSRALWAAAAASVLVGAAIVATRFVVAEVPPLTLALLRYGIAVLCVLPFVLGTLRLGDFTGRDLGAMAALGIGQFAILIALLNWGLQHVGAAQAALIFSLFPLLTLCLSAALGRERLTPALLGGVVLSIAGVALSLSPKLGGALGGARASDWWGEAAVLGSAAIGAVCSVLYRPYLQRYPTMQVSAWAMLASVLFLAGLAWPEGWVQLVWTLSPVAWGIVGFIGVSSAVGYFWWLYALKHESPTRVTVFLALNPITAALLGTLLLHEPLEAWSVGAIVLIAAGLWLATRQGAQANAPAKNR
jgi:drug/metabolite transporter (DMT)-like permease